MAKHELEMVEFTNMCMIFDESNGKVLVQNRNKNDWEGISFPGGHIEKGEAIIPSVIREVKEETGLNISNVVPCGFKDWYDYVKGKRYIVFFFKTTSFSGNLIEYSNEGLNTWMTIDEIKKSVTADDFNEMLDIFTGESQFKEFFYIDTKDSNIQKRWVKNFY